MQLIRTIRVLCLLVIITGPVLAQELKWAKNGESIWREEEGAIVAYQVKDNQRTVKVTAAALTPQDSSLPLDISDFSFTPDEKYLLVFTNTRRVWRYHTRGDYWLYDLTAGKLRQLGKSLPEASLMFTKISPDGTKAAYVSGHNLYVEDLAGGKTEKLTQDGSRRFINGTFDWAYEEEFSCRDGFRWSPDSKSIAYWQIDARSIRDFLMIDNTDSIYSFTIPVEYPKAGESPSACRVGIVSLQSKKTTWMQVPGDPRQHYIPRMEWLPGKNELVIQQLNRKQNTSRLMRCLPSGKVETIYTEQDEAWIDVKSRWDNDDITGWDWIQDGRAFVWVSEKDGWRHLYSISADGKKEQLLTPGDYDVINIARIDEKDNVIYIHASPENATQQYLYKVPLSGGPAERVTPANQPGTHKYDVSPGGQYAMHVFENHALAPVSERITLPDHKGLSGKDLGAEAAKAAARQSPVHFFQVTTEDGVTMDGWMTRPADFDSTKKYPVVFYVYGEPAGCTVKDGFGDGRNFLYEGDMSADGYIYISLDNRGTPAPKGRTWRKSIYRKIGRLNARDQAMAAKEILKWPYVDKDRIAVWGWSGGGSMTLNLLFQYPEIYKTGIAVAAVAQQLTYDNIYQERYMGLPQENRQDFIDGSPLTYARNLQGKLLYIHGTGDDNVHYQNAELLVNELIKHKKIFQFMPYPNRTHSISEGEGTFEHLSALYTHFLKENCAPGGK
ncbi:S9 family peptidase [Chitinophaga cymbidii]|uniref:Peptidase S9 n=1 Tax=Chitinophaga cymbidii TaxID=1096750 RepID=A0A512RSN9_9BACT|nr:S9 family peptidase [Chitinophaga cymbidii]GEP98707.1 peptidase S9 [Chitinophaga cymbidii]